MAGLVPAIHILGERIKQIPPRRVLPMNQPHLPRTRPVLDRLLSLDCGAIIVVLFKIDELLQVILLREPAYQTIAMFMAAPDEVAGDADVKRTIAAIGHYVNKAATHHTNQQDVDGRDKPGHDVEAYYRVAVIRETSLAHQLNG
jgi:hypothetical protein